MIQIEKSHLCAQPLLFDEDLVFDASYFPRYPIAGVKKLHLVGELSKDKESHIYAHLEIAGEIEVYDSYTNEVFSRKVEEDENFEILEKEDGESEGFIIPGKSFDLLELVLLVINFNLPPKLLQKGSKLPKGGEGYRILSSEEAEEDPHSSPFDVLMDADL